MSDLKQLFTKLKFSFSTKDEDIQACVAEVNSVCDQIEKLQEKVNELSNSLHQVGKLYNESCMRVYELESANEWISVGDKLPENKDGLWSEPVIAMCDCGLIYRLSCMGGEWQRTKSFAENSSKKVTHWMPLREPLK